MYKNNSGQYTQNIDKSVVLEKPVKPAAIVMRDHRPTGRRKVVKARVTPAGAWLPA